MYRLLKIFYSTDTLPKLKGPLGLFNSKLSCAFAGKVKIQK